MPQHKLNRGGVCRVCETCTEAYTALPLLAFALLLMAAFPTHADIVYLKTGGWVEGIVMEQTAGHVVVDLGFGTTRIEAEEIARIERASADEQRDLRQQWSKELSGQQRFTPPRLREMADSLDALSRHRARALRRAEHLRRLDRENGKMHVEIDSLRACYLAVNHELKSASPHGNVRAYNELVARLHRCRADVEIKTNELLVVQEDIHEGNPAASQYLAAYAGYERLLNVCLRRLGQLGPDERAFIEGIRGQLARFAQDFETVKIEQPNRSGNQIVVTAAVNGRAQGRFILDTGASHVVLSRAFACKAGCDTGDTTAVNVRLANGATVPARPVMLESVAVKNMTAEHIQAMVLDNPPSPGIDGLLGMTYLGRFFIHIDAQTNTLELKRFSADHR